ncbi:MAG: hypothetical protein RLY84_279, partial [Actinomycetota bacterium]
PLRHLTSADKTVGDLIKYLGEFK